MLYQENYLQKLVIDVKNKKNQDLKYHPKYNFKN